MSLAIKQLETVNVLEPRVKVNEVRRYAILKGGMQSSWKPVSSTSYSASNVQFTAPPPNPGVIVDRKVTFTLPMQINFSATANVGSGVPVIDIGGHDALRAFPISENVQNIAVTLNNTIVGINMNDVNNALLRYETPTDERQFDYSMSPSMLDQFQNYIDGYGTNRNPLSQYGDVDNEMARGGFPLEVVSNANMSGTGATGAAVVKVAPTEPIFLSPFMFGHHCSSGFIGLQTMDFNITLASNINRVWSHATYPAVTFNTPVVNIGQGYGIPVLNFNYITPQQLMTIPKSVVYPYYEVQRYITALPSMAAGAAPSLQTSNQIILKSVPKRMYIYARTSNATRTHLTTDTFLEITGLSIQWNNYTGLLSAATEPSIYQMCVDNGCEISWSQWHQQPVSSGSTQLVYPYGNAAATYSSNGSGVFGGYVGSVVCVEFGKDIALPDLEAPGILGQYSLQVNATIGNPNLSNSCSPELYIVTVSEGSFTIVENRAVAQIGVISKEDILNAKSNPFIDYSAARGVYGGGDFFGSVGDWFKGAYNTVKGAVEKAAPVVRDVASVAAKVAPLLAGVGATSGGRRHRRKKMDMEEGGVVVGGKTMSRAALKKRLGL